MRNIIDAIESIVTTHSYKVTDAHNYQIRINAQGEALEDYIKDAFAGAFGKTAAEKELLYRAEFSYRGSQNNPPDAMIKGGDAIEVKKISGFGGIALNSSHPHQTLKASDSKVLPEARNAEKWTEKDLIYAVGTVKNNKICHLSMVYGTEYCAKPETYLRLFNPIKKTIDELGKTFKDVTAVQTKELGRFNDIDPFKASNMRVRAMYEIAHPHEVFSRIYTMPASEFSLMCVISSEKLATFANRDILNQLSTKYPNFKVKDVNVKDPDDVTKTKSAKLITYFV